MKPEEPTQDSIQSSCQAIPITDIQNSTVTISHCIPKE